MPKKSILEFFIKGYLKSTKFTRSEIVRSRDLLNDAILSPCCVDELNPLLGIVGPTGTVNSGGNPYLYTITSAVTGIPDGQVANISLYINNTFIQTQDGNAFSYDGQVTAGPTSATITYYTVAVLQNGQTIVSNVQTLTVVENAPVWSFLQGQHIAQVSQTRHIVEVVTDVDPDTINITFLTLPSFCTTSLVPITGLRGGAACVVVDITVAPGALDAGTYSFTVRANDGVQNVDKVISLLVDANPHQRWSTRPTTPNVTLILGGGSQNLGSTIQSTLAINGTQDGTVPNDGTMGATVFPTSTTLSQPTINVGAMSGKYVTIHQSRNNAADVGSRYGDSIYYVINVV